MLVSLSYFDRESIEPTNALNAVTNFCTSVTILLLSEVTETFVGVVLALIRLSVTPGTALVTELLVLSIASARVGSSLP